MANELFARIIKQVEYYFGDVNFNHDNFLKEQSGKENGWIPISTLLTFNRLKAITDKDSDVADAFANANSEIVELNEAKDKLRRLKPLPEINDEFLKEYRQRAVHLRGFPKEGTTLDDLIEFCSQYGAVESVLMRRYNNDKKFKGCCFAVYKDVESANAALKGNDKFKGEFELNLRENKETYHNRKNAFRNRKKDKLINAVMNEGDDSKADDTKDEEKKTEDSEKKEEKVEKEVTFESGLVIKLINLPEKIHFKDIKPKLNEVANVQFVDIFPETRSAIVRFASLGDRDIILKTMDHVETATQNGKDKNQSTTENGKSDAKIENSTEDSVKVDQVEEMEHKAAEIDNSVTEKSDKVDPDAENEYKMLKISDNLIVKYTLIKGEEEKQYWIKIRKLTANPPSKNKHHHKKRFGGYAGNRFGKNKRPANGDRDNKKKTRVESEA